MKTICILIAVMFLFIGLLFPPALVLTIIFLWLAIAFK